MRLVLGALALFLAMGAAARADDRPISFLTVPPPPFARTIAPGIEVLQAQRSQVRLRKLSEKRNNQGETSAWLAENGLTPNWSLASFDAAVTGAAFGLPDAVRDMPLSLAVGDTTAGAAGAYGQDGRMIVVTHPLAGQAGLDLSAWTMPPDFVAADRDFVELETLALLEGPDKLYVATGHRTYAKSSKGINAFVTAFDPATAAILWQSDSLVANAGTMVLVGDALITGYGFTDEPDFLYVLDARDGSRVQKVPVKSGPETIVLKGDRLYVRTYNTDYVFAVEGLPK